MSVPTDLEARRNVDSTRLDLDPSRLDGVGLGQTHNEDSTAKFRRDLAGIDVLTDRKRPVEVADAVLPVEIVHVLLPRLRPAVDRQFPILELDIHIV